MKNAYLRVENLSKSFPSDQRGRKSKVEVIDNISFDVGKDEFVTFFGPNGCGKTTLLFLICGVLSPNDGRISINGKEPEESKMGFIFQNYRDSLYPWRRNIDNIAFPLEIQGLSLNKRHEKTRQYLKNLGISIVEKSYPYQLSGGQQQLVAISRALINEPELLLMDEPFGSLDYQTRMFMQDKLLEIWNSTKTTIVFVSHEVDEAVYLSDRIFVLSERPAKIMGIIQNNLPRPRKQELQRTENFHELRSKVLDLFQKSLKV